MTSRNLQRSTTVATHLSETVARSALQALLFASGAVACSSETVNLGRAQRLAASTADASVIEPAPSATHPLPTSGLDDAGPMPPPTDPVLDAGISPPAQPPADAMDASPPLPIDAGPRTPIDASKDAGPSLPQAPSFGEPVLVAVINSDVKDDNPTLTADMTEIYFSSSRADDSDVWVAVRSSVSEDFSEPERVDTLSTDYFDSSPAVEPDGLTLWVGSETPDGVGGLDIWQSRRETRSAAWPVPLPASELNSAEDDIPRPTGNGRLTMPLSSRRAEGTYQLYLADRPTVEAPFTEPRLVAELTRDDSGTVDAFLTDDGLTIYYVYAAEELGDLYVSSRSSLGEPFGAELALDSINTDADERDPWLSPDGSILYFASDRDGDLNIYAAERLSSD